jgi:D-alanyl-D-alanine carboxypeptidase
MKQVLTLICVILMSILVQAQQPSNSKLPDSPSGKCIAEYIASFNSGDENAMRAFFVKCVAKSQLEQVPLDRRLDRYRQMKERMGKLEFKKVTESRDDILSVLLSSTTSGLFEFTFEFEPEVPHSFTRIRVEKVEDADSVTPRAAKSSDSELLHAVHQYLDDRVKADEFSGVVLVAKNGKLMFSEAYGMADKEKQTPNRLDTKFNIGSINKIFTSTAIHQLEQQGKLSLDDPIKKYLPDYPNKEAASLVTIRQLLDMTSGIGDIFGDRYEATPKEQLRTIKDFLPLFADKPLEFKPGSQHRYSNGGYVVLGAIIEQASGMDYYTYVRENIFKPASMLDTDSFEKDADIPNRAKGYTKMLHGESNRGKSRVSNCPSLPGRGGSAGGGYSTAGDLLRFTVALKEGKLSSPETQGALGVAGGAPGLNAALEWDPRRGYAIIVLSNYDPPSAEIIARQIRSWLPAR